MNALVVVSTFLAAGVEWVEALTIVLAVGLYMSWRSAMTGMLAALAALAALVAALAVGLSGSIPLGAARTVVGVFLLLFGLKWLHKAILRAAGLRSLHSETAEFDETRRHLLAERQQAGAARAAVATSFGGVFLEGLEVIFIVIALGGAGHLPGAVSGALAALAVVVLAGVVLRRPLTQVPENAMKFVVGVMLTSFGTFFAGEGLGARWWHGDLTLLLVIAAYAFAALGFVVALRRFARPTPRPASAPARVARSGMAGAVATAGRTVLGLFVDDGALALVALAVVAGVALYLRRAGAGADAALAGSLFVLGVLVALGVGLRDAIVRVPGR